jgi:hypothetical protein
VPFLRPLAAACRGLVRGGRVGVAAISSVVSQLCLLALVSVWWRCSAIGCLPVLGLVVVDGCAVGTCRLPGARSRLGGSRRRCGPWLAGGGVGAGTRGVRAGLWGDAGSCARPVVDIVVKVALLFVLLACRGAFLSGRLRSAVAVALDVFPLVRGLQLAGVVIAW